MSKRNKTKATPVPVIDQPALSLEERLERLRPLRQQSKDTLLTILAIILSEYKKDMAEANYKISLLEEQLNPQIKSIESLDRINTKKQLRSARLDEEIEREITKFFRIFGDHPEFSTGNKALFLHLRDYGLMTTEDSPKEYATRISTETYSERTLEGKIALLAAKVRRQKRKVAKKI